VARVYSLVADSSNNASVLMQPVQCAAFEELGPTATHGTMDVDNLQAKSTASPDVRSPTMRVESIPLRGSVRIRNITEHLSLGGEVRIMRLNGDLLLASDTGDGMWDPLNPLNVRDFLSICDMMRDTKRAKTFGAGELVSTHQSNTYPADSVRSHTFGSDTSFVESVAHPKFCSLIILIDDFRTGASQTNNTYSLDFVVHRAARFRPGSLLHSKQLTFPTNQQAHTKQQSHESFVERVLIPLKAGVDAVSPILSGGAAFMSSIAPLAKQASLYGRYGSAFA
jgi:hypothetical protein